MPAEIWAPLPILAVLMCLSGFFSGSEAAYFSLSMTERRALAKSGRVGGIAARLLNQPERLLMGILFWNLAINLAYFSVVSRISLTIDKSGDRASLAAGVSLGGLIAIVVLGEFLPKSLAVVNSLAVAKLTAIPLTVAIRVLDNILPAIRVVNEASRRILWPGLKPEPYLELADLDRAVELSAEDASLFEQESQVLRNLIQLGEIHVEEWMRPRTEYQSFTPPISAAQLHGQSFRHHYLLVTDRAGREVLSYIDLRNLRLADVDHIEQHKQPMVVVPWCASMADTLNKLITRNRRVAAVVNEMGDTVGILTWEDIFEAMLQLPGTSVRPHREFARAEVNQTADDTWLATGMTKLRKLERIIGRKIHDINNLTVGGIVQEQLHRLPEVGDSCEVEDLRFEVVEAGLRGEILVKISLVHTQTGEQT
jgi:putative hemolysin